jgi:predicted AAA+ superfamily ATPase
MKTLLELCQPRKSVFDKSRRDVVLDITDLTENKIDPAHFFAENYITRGMKDLYQAVFKRLEGKTDDGVFKLTQTMGGGKTHNMIAVGLLAMHPDFRDRVMGDVYRTAFQDTARVIGFTGRENPRFGIWGHIAEQLGKRDAFKEYYDPLQAPGQSAWINLLRGEKVLILLDELPPYFQSAKARQIGNSDLAEVTTQALSNLLAALGKDELKQVALIISDLTANYAEGTGMISQVLDNYAAEVNRVAKNFTPVQQTGDEIYHILRTRLFVNTVPPGEIEAVAAAYSGAIREAKQMDITTETPERFQAAVIDSFPFHPGVKDLYARFKENPGFMQTRGLIRFMRTVVARMWDRQDGWAGSAFLIAPHDIDLHDSDTLTEIAAINSSLTNAISHDIAGNPTAVAENLDASLGHDLATRTARLLLVSSLATVQNAVRGLKDTEIIRNLCAPGINISEIQSKVLPELKSSCWYLHLDNAGNFLFKNVQNVVAKLKDYMSGYTDEAIEPEIRKKLAEIFHPVDRDCYQRVYALPAPDQIALAQEQVSLIIYKPYPWAHPSRPAKTLRRRHLAQPHALAHRRHTVHGGHL